jgi:hypothetical protein
MPLTSFFSVCLKFTIHSSQLAFTHHLCHSRLVLCGLGLGMTCTWVKTQPGKFTLTRNRTRLCTLSWILDTSLIFGSISFSNHAHYILPIATFVAMFYRICLHTRLGPFPSLFWFQGIRPLQPEFSKLMGQLAYSSFQLRGCNGMSLGGRKEKARVFLSLSFCHEQPLLLQLFL